MRDETHESLHSDELAFQSMSTLFEMSDSHSENNLIAQANQTSTPDRFHFFPRKNAEAKSRIVPRTHTNKLLLVILSPKSDKQNTPFIDLNNSKLTHFLRYTPPISAEHTHRDCSIVIITEHGETLDLTRNPNLLFGDRLTKARLEALTHQITPLSHCAQPTFELLICGSAGRITDGCAYPNVRPRVEHALQQLVANYLAANAMVRFQICNFREVYVDHIDRPLYVGACISINSERYSIPKTFSIISRTQPRAFDINLKPSEFEIVKIRIQYLLNDAWLKPQKLYELTHQLLTQTFPREDIRRFEPILIEQGHPIRFALDDYLPTPSRSPS